MKKKNFKLCGKKALLLVDSLKIYQQNFDEIKPKNSRCEIKIIPPSTTGMIQPCDVGIFKDFKKLHVKLSEITREKCQHIEVHARDNVLKLILATHIQYCAPRFQNFIRESFVKCGYIERKNYVAVHPKPLTYCINVHIMDKQCSIRDCINMADVKCAWCEKEICILHLVFSDRIHECMNRRLFEDSRYAN